MNKKCSVFDFCLKMWSFSEGNSNLDMDFKIKSNFLTHPSSEAKLQLLYILCIPYWFASIHISLNLFRIPILWFTDFASYINGRSVDIRVFEACFAAMFS